MRLSRVVTFRWLLLQEDQSASLLRNVLIPLSAIEWSGTNSFRRSYPATDRFTTRIGTVGIDYNAGDKKVGTVVVRAQRSNPRGLLWEETVDLTNLV